MTAVVTERSEVRVRVRLGIGSRLGYDSGDRAVGGGDESDGGEEGVGRGVTTDELRLARRHLVWG